MSDDGLGSAADARSRARDIEAAFLDPEVRLVISAIGGHTACSVLDHLDMSLLVEHPTWLCGYSDVTALLLPLWAATGMQSLYGPQVLPQLGEFGGCSPYTWSGVVQATAGELLAGRYRPSGMVVTETLSWDEGDDRVRETAPAPLPWTVRPGTGTGTALAANLDVLVRLAGTEYMPDFDGSVLVLEMTEPPSPAAFEAALWQFARARDMTRLSGLVFGRFPERSGLNAPDVLTRILDRLLPECNLPVVAGVDVGHTDPQATVVCGGSLELEAATAVEIRGNAVFPVEA